MLFALLAPLAAAQDPGGGYGSSALRRVPELRSTLRTSTVIWGLVLLTGAAQGLSAVLLLPVAATAATAPTIATVAVLVGCLRFYLPHRLRCTAHRGLVGELPVHPTLPDARTPVGTAPRITSLTRRRLATEAASRHDRHKAQAAPKPNPRSR